MRGKKKPGHVLTYAGILQIDHEYHWPQLIDDVFLLDCRELLTWGAGRFGQLGNSRMEDTAVIQKVTSYVRSEEGKIIQVL